MTTSTISIRRLARRAAAASAGIIAAGCLSGAVALAAAPPLSWAPPVSADQGFSFTAVTCQPGTLCVAVDSFGNAITTTNPAGNVWSTPIAVDGINHPSLLALACPASTLCIALDLHSAYTTTTPTSPSWTAFNIDPTHTLTAISCPTATLCVAADDNGNVLSTATPADGTSWVTQAHVDGTTSIQALSCPTTSLCVAVDATGHVLVSTNPTAASSWPAMPTQLSSAALTAVSCNVGGVCVAAASDGSVYATGNVAGTPVTWSTTLLDSPGPLNAVSCTDIGLCVLVDHAGKAFESDNPAAGPPSWTASAIDSTNGLTGVSCISAGLCVAVDDLGNTIPATLPAPAVATGAGSASSQTTASLAATVNPGDATLSDCHFEFGPTTSYGTSVPCAPLPAAGAGIQAVTAQLTGLSGATTYHFRVVAANAYAAPSGGADGTFVTAALLKAAPSLSGTPAVANTLTCKPNVTLSGALTLAYQWLSDTTPIPGATLPTYVIAPTDATHHLSCAVTLAGDGGSTVVNSGFDSVPSETAGKIAETLVGTDGHSATGASAPVTCSPQAAGSCTIKMLLTTTRRAKHKTQTVTIGAATVKIPPGTTKNVSVSLNATGRQMLMKQHRLAATLTVSGTVIGSLTATLQTDKLTFATRAKARKPKAKKAKKAKAGKAKANKARAGKAKANKARAGKAKANKAKAGKAKANKAKAGKAKAKKAKAKKAKAKKAKAGKANANRAKASTMKAAHATHHRR